jgi:hypothetical protein
MPTAAAVFEQAALLRQLIDVVDEEHDLALAQGGRCISPPERIRPNCSIAIEVSFKTFKRHL